MEFMTPNEIMRGAKGIFFLKPKYIKTELTIKLVHSEALNLLMESTNINREHICEGITVHECEMDGLDEDKAEDLLTNIDDMIIWRWFK